MGSLGFFRNTASLSLHIPLITVAVPPTVCTSSLHTFSKVDHVLLASGDSHQNLSSAFRIPRDTKRSLGSVMVLRLFPRLSFTDPSRGDAPFQIHSISRNKYLEVDPLFFLTYFCLSSNSRSYPANLQKPIPFYKHTQSFD